MLALVYSPTQPLPPSPYCNLIIFVYGCTTKNQKKDLISDIILILLKIRLYSSHLLELCNSQLRLKTMMVVANLFTVLSNLHVFSYLIHPTL